MAERPNVVFVITDDQGYGDLGCTGNPIIQTPNIDQLYNDSIRFTDYHVGPTCAPTRAGLLTGHYHNSTGVWHTIGGRSLLRKNEVSLADIFQRNGYKTGIFGKWHLGDNYPYRPHDRGFDEAVIHGGGGVGQTPDYWENDYFDDTYYDKGTPRNFKGYCTDVWFELGMDFITRHKEGPFFCYIPTNAPHSPFQVEDKYADLYRGEVPEERARFYGMITNIDENVGKLLRHLEGLNLLENTIFIFMTDNGSAGGCTISKDGFVHDGYNANMRGMKGSPYEGGHRVPFMLQWLNQGYSLGQDVSELTANVDFMPTLIDLCKLSVPQGLEFDGLSLVPLMENSPVPWKDRIIVTDSQRVPDPIMWKDSAVMQGKWRLINGEELYHVGLDPEQRKNVANLYNDLVLNLRQGYEEWWLKVSKRFCEEIPISIGSKEEKVTKVTSHDWRGGADECAWNQGQIRTGKICNSYVEIYIERDGTYTFELRRWPLEEDRGITEGITGPLEGWFSGGVSISVNTASIQIGRFKQTKSIAAGDKAIIFQADLKKGPTHMQTFFEDASGNTLGAYYVYIRKIS